MSRVKFLIPRSRCARRLLVFVIAAVLNGADFVSGAPDTEFSLRAERAGSGAGRKYTVVYTAMDMSGNTTADTVCVRVPHDLGGVARASTGFLPTGGGLFPDAVSFELIVPSGAGFGPSSIAHKDVYVGNHIGAMRPSAVLLLDANDDGQMDLVATFEVAATLDLREASRKKYPLGLHFKSCDQDGTGFEDASNGVASEPIATPAGEALSGTGTFRFRIEEAGLVSIDVFRVTGRRIRMLVRGDFGTGEFEAPWDGRGNSGRSVSSGAISNWSRDQS